MPRPEFRIWATIQANLGATVQPHVRRRIQEKYELWVLECLAEELPAYLAQWPDPAGNASTLFTLADLIARHEWPNGPAPEPAWEALDETPPSAAPAPEPVVFGSQPWITDSLVQEMPPLVQALVAARLQGTSICVDYAIAGALATVAACAGNRIKFSSWGDSEHLPNIYLVLVGETGRSYKSSVCKWVKGLLSEVDPAALAADESSVEAMIRDLAERPSRLWVQDEFAGLLGAMKGRDYMRPVREALLSLYDHVGVYRRRLMRAEFAATDPALSLLTTIQPAVMGEELFSGRNVDSGFVNRLLLVCGSPSPEQWPSIEDWRPLRNDITAKLRGLANMPAVRCNASGVLEIAMQWDGAEEKAFGPYGKYVAARSSTHCLKIAALLETANNWPGGKNIEPRWAHLAAALLDRWYRASAQMIEDVHIKQPGERDRRDFFEIACRHTHNGTGPVGIGRLSEEAQISKRKAEDYMTDLQARGWLGEGDEQEVFCLRRSPLCPSRVAV